MISSSWRCLTALVVFGLAVVRADSQWTAVFPAADGESVSSAFVVGDGRHVVAVALSGAKAERGRLRMEGRELPAEVFVDPVSRLVIFRMTGPPGKALPLSAGSSARAGATVVADGGVSGKTTGWIKHIEGKILPLALLSVEYSGKAPLPGTPLMDKSGGVMAVAHQTTATQTGYALPVEVVKRVFDDVQRGGRVTRGWIGLKLRPEASVPQITRVQEGSPSALAGIKAGDVLVGVGSRNLGDYADAVNAFYFLRPGASTSVRLKRGEQELTISVTPVERGSD